MGGMTIALSITDTIFVGRDSKLYMRREMEKKMRKELKKGSQKVS